MAELKSVSKQYLAEQVIKMLGGGLHTSDNKISIQQAMAVVGELRNKLLWNELFTRYKIEGSFSVPSSVLSEYTATSYKDNDKWYVDLPAKVLSLYNDMGVYQVFVDDNEYLDIIPATSTFRSMFKGLPSFNAEGQPVYILRGDKMEIVGIDKEVKMELILIVDSVSLSPRDDFKFISELQNDLLLMAVEEFKIQARIPQDEVLDDMETRG